MELVRIGDKLIDKEKIENTIEEIFKLRLKGMSQQEAASTLNIDRTFISRLESIGEVRKGGKIAVIAFPIGNKEELTQLLEEKKIEYYFVMTDEERIDFISNKTAQELLNETMNIVSKVRTFDTIIIIGSNYRIKLCKALLDKEVIGVEIGKSPIKEDVIIDIVVMRELLSRLELNT